MPTRVSRLEQTLNKPKVVLVVGVLAVALNVLLYFGLFLPRMTPLIAHMNPIGTSLPEAILPGASSKSDSEAGSKPAPEASGNLQDEASGGSVPEGSVASETDSTQSSPSASPPNSPSGSPAGSPPSQQQQSSSPPQSPAGSPPELPPLPTPSQEQYQ